MKLATTHTDGCKKPSNLATPGWRGCSRIYSRQYHELSADSIKMRDRENEADLARTLIHEYAHALLHFDVGDDTERSKREVEAEAVTYVVGRYCGLDTSGSAFYLAAWESDDPEIVRDRLDRISSTAEELIDVLKDGA